MPTFRTLPAYRLGAGIYFRHFLTGMLNPLGKGPIKVSHHFLPGLFTGSDQIQVRLHFSGEVDIDNVGKELRQQIIDGDPRFRRSQPPSFFLDVSPPLQGIHDRGVRGRTTDPIFFQGADQCCL